MNGSLLAPAPFVGRVREMGVLHGALAGALAGAGSTALVYGDPGIGKTRIAEELATTAHAAGMRPLWGRCIEGEGAPAFWPWIQLLDSFARELDAHMLRTDLGAAAPAIAQLVPGIAARLPGLPPPDPVEPDAARFRLFDGITGFLGAVSSRAPLLLILDDLHHADRPSLLLLEFLARELRERRILVLGSYRDIEVGRGHPLTRTLAELSRLSETRRIGLRGIDEAAVGRLMGELSGSDVPPELVHAVWQQTEGNPFFTLETVRLLDVHDAGAEKLPLPQTVREVIDLRLARLSVECQQLLTVAAVIGREFPANALAHAGETRGEDVLEMLEQAEAARVIGPVSSRAGWYWFTHVLIRETLYEELPATRRARLHLRAGEALEHLWAAGIQAHVSELAHHFVSAYPAGGLERAVRYAQRAGEAANGVFAWEEAATWWRTGECLLAEAPEAAAAPSVELRCDLLLALAEVYRMLDERASGRDACLRAADIARALESPTRLAQAAITLRFFDGLAGERSRTLLEEAIQALGAEDSSLRARVMVCLAHVLYWQRLDERTASLTREALQIARRLGEPHTLAYVLTRACYTLWRLDHLEEREHLVAELITLAESLGDKTLMWIGHCFYCQNELHRGHLRTTAAEVETCARLAAAVRRPMFTAVSLSLRTTLDQLAGKFTEAARITAQLLAVAERDGLTEQVADCVAAEVVTSRSLGVGASLVRRVHEQIESSHMPALWRSASMLLSAEAGADHEARKQLRAEQTSGFASIPHDYNRPASLAFLVETAWTLWEPEPAWALYEALLPYRGLNIVVGAGSGSLGAADRYLGLAATVSCRWAEASSAFSDALTFNEGMGARPWAAHTRHDHAAMLFKRHQSVCQKQRTMCTVSCLSRARELASDALTAAREMGMARLEQQATVLLDQLRCEDANVSKRVTLRQKPLPGGLTEREAQVLRLLADGRSNQEIADALVVSINTATRHIANIYTKIGVSRRAEATAYAIRHGLST